MKHRSFQPQRFFCSLLGGITAWLALLFAVVLGVGALLYTARFDPSTYAENVTIFRRSLLTALPSLLAAALVCPAAAGLPARFHRISAVCFALAVSAVGLIWAVTLSSPPVNDQAYVWELAVALVQGDRTPFLADYATAYPHQFGPALLASLFVRLFGAEPLPAFALFNAVCAGACTAALCRLAELLSDDNRAATICGLLCLLFCPLALYTAFVYGTLFSTAAFLWGIYCAVRLCRGGAFWWWLPLYLLLPLACVSYGSALIPAIAVFLLLFLSGLIQGGRRLLCLCLPALGLGLLCILLPSACQALVCLQMELPHLDGIPKTAWLAMGIHSNNGVCGPGSWDGSNWDLFFTNGADSSAANAAALQNLRQYLKGYRDEPHRVVFFVQKTACQWLDPWFGALTQTYAPSLAAPSAPAAWLCTGPLLHPVQGMLSALLPLIYLCSGVELLFLRRCRRYELWSQVLPLVFVGGFLFQLFWESKSRYCLPFVLVLIPLAASALLRCFKAAAAFYSRRSLS